MKREMKRFHMVGLVSLVILGLMSLVSSQGPVAKSHAPASSQAGCVPAPSGLVAWWPGDGNTDDIIGGNNGTLMNGATFAPGLVGQAFSFDGVNDFVNVPDSSSLDFGQTSPMTVDLWAFRTGTNSPQHLIGKRLQCTVGSAGINYQMAWVSSTGLVFGAGGGNEVVTGMNLPLNTWKHLAGTFDGTTYRFYIDGQFVAMAAGTPGPPNAAPLKIGNSGDCQEFAGLIDEVEIFNRALSAAEIQAIFDAGSAGKCKGPACSLEPASASNPVGTDHAVTVTVTEGVAPVAGVSVTFNVTSGPNVGQSGSGTTDDNGQASFTYTSNGQTGTDTIEASGSVGGVPISCTATKTWTPPSCTLTPASDTNPVGTNHTVTATVTSNGTPLSGVLVNFSVTAGPNAGTTGTGTTDANGQASFTYTSNGMPGTDTIEASGSVSSVSFSCTATKNWNQGLCPATTAVEGTPDEAETLALLYRFRDEVLAQTPRGQQYTRWFYQFSPEVVSLLSSNPSLLLRTQEQLMRYKPVIAAMINRAGASGRLMDLKQVNDLLRAFAAEGSLSLRNTVDSVRRDLRDPKMHAEFGVSLSTTHSTAASIAFQTRRGGASPQPVLHGLLVTDDANNQLTALISNDDGTFRPSQLIPTGDGPSAIALGDFNQDGWTDVVTVNERSHDLTILLGQGDGTFDRGPSLSVGSQPSAVVAGDFTGDGTLDLVVADAGDNDLWLLKGRGDGTFERGQRVAVGSQPSAMVTGDFNGDGRLDLVVSNFGSSDVMLLLGRGDSTLTRSGSFSVGEGLIGLSTGDVDGDGREEVITVNFTSNDLTILKAGGRRGLTVMRRLSVGEGPVAVVAGEFVAGRAGLAAANLMSGEVTIWLADEKGVFNRLQKYAVTPAPASITMGDFNGDGRVDLAVLDADGVTLRVLLSNGDGTFRPAR